MKSYAKIVAPLIKIEKQLQDYIVAQKNNINGLEDQKAKIESQIGESNLEIKRSQFTSGKISEMLAADGDDSYEDEEEDSELNPTK